MQSRKPFLIAGRSIADMFGISIAVIILAVVTFKKDSFTIEPDSPDVVWVKKTWWGFKEDYRQVRWSNGSWRAKSKSGEWHSFLREDDTDPAEYVPVR